jgi:hypothetical protein
MKRDALLAGFNPNAPATARAIKRCQAGLKFTLPVDYVQFLQRVNGGEGFIGKWYVILHRVEELLELNANYHFDDFVSWFFFFGSDGGGEGFAFDLRVSALPITAIPFIGMEPDNALTLGSNFNSFLKSLHRLDSLVKFDGD